MTKFVISEGVKIVTETLHKRMRKLVEKTKWCFLCEKNRAKDLANVSGFYRQSVADWFWLCRQCHSRHDNGWWMIKKKWWKKCKKCKTFLQVNSKNFYQRKTFQKWSYVCKSCHIKLKNENRKRNSEIV